MAKARLNKIMADNKISWTETTKKVNGEERTTVVVRPVGLIAKLMWSLGRTY